jgi:site-specific recombinase XerD
MLRGWRIQQQSRQLSDDTIEPRERYIVRLHEFAGDYPWNWAPATLEEFTAVEFRSKNRAKSTIRQMQNAVGLFCEYIGDIRYDWVAICHEAFGKIPVQICTEMNTSTHGDEYEGAPERRPFTRREVLTFFDFIDDRYELVCRRKRKGSLALLRDSTLFKTVYAWGLRRREVAKLSLRDRLRNPKIPEYGIYGALHARFGKAVKGGPPRRRVVLSLPHHEWAIDALKYYCDEVRPQFNPGKHPALFISERHGYLTPSWIDDRFKEFRVGAGLPDELDLHSLRHAYATHGVEDDVDGIVMQGQLGHTWGSTTGLYVHVSRKFKLEAMRAAYEHLYGRVK